MDLCSGGTLNIQIFLLLPIELVGVMLIIFSLKNILLSMAYYFCSSCVLVEGMKKINGVLVGVVRNTQLLGD